MRLDGFHLLGGIEDRVGFDVRGIDLADRPGDFFGLPQVAGGDGPLPLEDVSIVSRATESGAAVSSDDDVSAGEGAAVGAVWGGLVGLAALLIPGIGPFVAGGALFAALTGAVTGAVVGGITAALVDFGGISEEEARGYETQVHAGKTLVAVKARDEDAVEVRRVLVNAGALSLRDNQTDIAGSNAPVHVATDGAAGREIEAGLTGASTVIGTPPAAPSAAW